MIGLLKIFILSFPFRVWAHTWPSSIIVTGTFSRFGTSFLRDVRVNFERGIVQIDSTRLSSDGTTKTSGCQYRLFAIQVSLLQSRSFFYSYDYVYRYMYTYRLFSIVIHVWFSFDNWFIILQYVYFSPVLKISLLPRVDASMFWTIVNWSLWTTFCPVGWLSAIWWTFDANMSFSYH